MNLTEIIQSKNDGKTLSNIDEMRYNFITQRLDEEVYKGYIIAYHRTHNAKEFIDISNKIGFSTLGKVEGSMYGVGLYGNYTWDGVNTKYSKREYGNYIIKYIVKPNNVIFFDEYTQLKVYGKRMSIIEQCNYWGIKLNNDIKIKIKVIDDEMSSNKYQRITSSYAFEFYEQILSKDLNNYPSDIISQFYGISYNGHNDQETILMYDFRNLTILGYYDIKNVFHKTGDHQFYNIKSVSKNIGDNTNADNLFTPQDNHQPSFILDKNKVIDKNRIFDGKSLYKLSQDVILKILKQRLKQSNDINKFNREFIDSIIKKDTKFYVVSDNRIDFISEYTPCNLSKIKLSSIPLKFNICNERVFIVECDFEDLSFMFDSISEVLILSKCYKLKSLYGIENMSYSPLSSEQVIRLIDLTSLRSLQYLPLQSHTVFLEKLPHVDLIPILNYENIKTLSINNCDNIKLSDGLPPNIERLYYSSSNNNIDLSFLNGYKKLKYVSLNNKELKLNKKNNKWSYTS